MPVGQDQLPHLELARTIARRFNDRYSPDRPYFPAPEPLLSTAALVLGLDGQKMSKSRGNAIPLGATEEETAALIRRATTDADRHITYEPARRPEIAEPRPAHRPLPGTVPGGGGGRDRRRRCRGVEAVLTEAVNGRFSAIRARRMELIRDPLFLRDVLHQGNARARAVAEETLEEVRSLMYTVY